MLSYEEIVKIISDLNLWGREQETGIERKDYLKTISEFSGAKEDAIVIVGIRRSGKTYLTKQFLKNISDKTKKEQTLYVNFEDPKLDPYLSLSLLDEIYGAYRTYINKNDFAWIVFDEIQNIPIWEKWVRIMQEKKENVKILLSGSSSKLLSAEFSSVLTGRCLKIEVFPISFKEFLYFNKVEFEKDYDILVKSEEIKRNLHKYLKYGGFPKVALEENENLKKEYLKEIFEGIVYREILARHKIKDAGLVKAVVEFGINYFSSLMSANKIRNIITDIFKRQVSPNSILDILKYAEETYLLFFVPIFSYKIKDQKLYPKKIYCIDSGLINIVSLKFSDDFGRIYENIVAIELKRRIKEIYYWKDSQQREVDFVVIEDKEPDQLIQVCYDVKNPETKKRETFALVKASEELKCENLWVITYDYENEEIFDGKLIKFISLWKWLLI